jgi:predicted nuclease with TOPRIM domain
MRYNDKSYVELLEENKRLKQDLLDSNNTIAKLNKDSARLEEQFQEQKTIAKNMLVELESILNKLDQMLTHKNKLESVEYEKMIVKREIFLEVICKIKKLLADMEIKEKKFKSKILKIEKGEFHDS